MDRDVLSRGSSPVPSWEEATAGPSGRDERCLSPFVVQSLSTKCQYETYMGFKKLPGKAIRIKAKRAVALLTPNYKHSRAIEA